MANEKKPVRIIPKEKAVFRLDKNRVWHLGNEKFTNQKIFKYFLSFIKRDTEGFFLQQEHRDFIEKVYFPYDDTAFFVFRVIKKEGLTLCLNTGENRILEPEKLVMKDDDLYIQAEEILIKLHVKDWFS